LLDYKFKVLHSITPNNAQTWCLPYHYEAKADCPTIKAWLLQAVNGDANTVLFLRAWLAALLQGRADLQKFLHLIGSGGTGKGTFIRLATVLVGEHNAVSTTLKEMETNRFEPARFYGARLVKITDSDKYGGSINTLKAMTGQDHIRIERKHQQQSGDFIFGGLVIMASNENLTTTDHTSGLDRRRLTVYFDKRVSDEDKQKWQALGGEEAVLHSEIAGLVNWLLELSHEDISRIIRNPPEHTKQANFTAMTAGNPIAEWLTECCIPDSTAWTQIGDKRELREQGTETKFENADKWLYPNYLTWCQRYNKSPHSVRRFREILVDTLKTLKVDVIESRRSQGQGITNIRLKKDYESAFTDWNV
jgi:putative DNA primase/helicase